MDFFGKTVVVTGGTQGVGCETAKLFARSGARGVAICGRNEQNGVAVAEELRRISCRS